MNGEEVVASTGDPAFAVNEDGEITAWNPAAEQHLQYSAREALGRRCWEVLRGRDAFTNRYCSEHCPLREMANRGEPFHRAQMSFRTAHGAHLRVNVSALVVPGRAYGDKQIVHLVELLPENVVGDADCDQAAVLPRANNAHLTNRQLEVLKYLAEGKTTRQIGEALGISSSTVRHHIQRVLCGLNVHSRLHAVSLARRIGLI